MAEQGRRQGESRQDESAMAARPGERESGLARRFQDPFAMFDWMFDRMQRDLFGPSAFGGLLAGHGEAGAVERVPRVEMREEGDTLVLMAELPGIEPNDAQIELEQDVLTIRGQSRGREEREGRTMERSVSFFRQLRLPEGVDPERAEASYRNGMLTIRFPRAARAGTRQIPISSEGEGQPRPSRERAA